MDATTIFNFFLGRKAGQNKSRQDNGRELLIDLAGAGH